MVGTFVEYQLITKKNVPYPIINVDGKEYLVMGIVEPYTDELKQKLDNLTPKEQWNALSKFYKRK